MTENKRFTLSDSDLREVNNTVAIADGGIPCTQRHICKLLNELAEENNEFKIDEEFKNKAYSDLLDNFTQLKKKYQKSKKENKELKHLIKKTLETTPIEHTLAVELKNSVRELYD